MISFNDRFESQIHNGSQKNIKSLEMYQVQQIRVAKARERAESAARTRRIAAIFHVATITSFGATRFLGISGLRNEETLLKIKVFSTYALKVGLGRYN